MEAKNSYLKVPKTVVYGLYFILAGIIVNYIFRDVFHSISVDKFILHSDPEGYYQYLPHFFLRDWEHFKHLPWAIPYGEGKTLSVFTSGVAILWSPFFLMAHFFSVFFNLEATGHGNIYYGFVLIAALFYVYTGLYFLYKLLAKEFGHKVSLITAGLFLLGTNLFYYTVILGAGMSHAYSFSMIAIYIYFTHRFYETGKIKHLILFALPLAVAVLIRPTNIIAGLYFFMFGVFSGKTMLEKGHYWLKNYRALGIVLLAGVIVAIPQMLYWHTVTGKFITYSYQDYGFPYLLNPKIGIVLIGKYNGWLFYTPLVIFALYGLFRALLSKTYNSLAILLILVLAIYINASWWAPTFSAAVGQRAMIDFLPLLAFPLAWVVKGYFEQSKAVRTLLFVILLAILFFNIQFAFRYEAYEWWDKPFTWAKFWRTLKF
jgi:hypothetical protein